MSKYDYGTMAGGLAPHRIGWMISRICDAPQRLSQAFSLYLRRQREYEELMGLPDYLLEDIGLTRAQAHEMTRRHIL